jgi:DedD protein
MMDRALKERIIGAAVLVVVVVLVVPVFLDGPSNDGEVVNERVPLPGQSDQEIKTIVLDRDRSNPVPANSSTESAQPVTQPRQAVVEPEPQTEEVEKEPEPVVEKPAAEEQSSQALAAAPSATGMWAVQLGSFGNKENAERLAADLRKQGFAAFLSQLTTSSGQLHRVRIGPQKDRESAEAMAERLAKAGHKGKVLPHP